MTRSPFTVAVAASALVSATILGAMPASSAIIGTCTILIQNNGTLAVNPAIDVLSSLQAGGNAARVTVEPDSLVCSILNLLDCYRLSAPPPVAFVTAPAGGGDTVSFASTYRIDGGAAISGATTTRLINDTYSVDVDLTATRAAGIFPTGSYQAQVTVRCE